jgi:hypothetical protein
MADKLLPKVPASTDDMMTNGTCVAAASAASGAPGKEGVSGRSSSCTPLFRTWVTLFDGAGGEWQVQYDGWQFKGRVKDQRHLRLTCGWKNFVRSKDVQIGGYADGTTMYR